MAPFLFKPSGSGMNPHENQKYSGQYFLLLTSVRKPKTTLSESDIQYFEFIFSVSSSLRVSAESVLDFYHSFCAGGWVGLTFVAHFVTCGSHLLLFFLANIFRWNPIVCGFQRGMFANGSLWTNLCCREGKRKANIIFLPRCCLAPCYESNHNHRSRFILSQRCFSSSCQPRKVIYQICIYFTNTFRI